MTDKANFDPGALSDVRATPDGDRWKLIFSRTLRHAPEHVWSALTEPGQLSQWAPFDADRDLGQPGDAVLTMAGGDASASVVRRAEPPALLEYTWGEDLLRWELAPVDLPTGPGTRLTLNHTLADRDWMPKVAAGWHICLVVAENLLNGQPIGRIVGDDAKNYGWQELSDSYQDRLAE